MAGETFTGRPAQRDTGEPKKPFWERPISRRRALQGAALTGGGLTLGALLSTLTGRGHSPEKPVTGSPAVNTKPQTNANTTNGEVAPTSLEADLILKSSLVSLDGKQTTVKELAAKGPVALVAWSSIDNSEVSKSWISKVNTQVYPQFANSGVQFLAVETWDTLPNLKKALAENRPYLQELSFPVVVATGKEHHATALGRTGYLVLIDKGGGNIQEFHSGNFDQMAPAIAKLASGN